MVRAWLREHYAPVRRGVMLPVSVTVSVLCTVVGVLDSLPATAGAVGDLTHYRGADLTDGYAWRLLLSPFGAYNLLHVAWTLANVALVLVPLEARIRPLWTIVVLAVGHYVPSLVAFVVLSAADADRALRQLDYGASGAMMCAAAALAVVRRSRAIGVALLAVLVFDVFYSDPLTVCEHWGSAVLGVVLGVFLTRR